MTETEEQPRRGWLKAMPYFLLAAYVLVPLVLIPAAGSSAPAATIVFLFGTAGLVSLIDATLFRPTYSIPLLCGVGFWLAKVLYLNEGTFVYGLGCVVIAGVCSWLGGVISGRGGRGGRVGRVASDSEK